MWEKWVASLKKYSNKTDYLSFILCIAGIILLAWTLKNCIKAGDEVIAGISAALITLLGVNLTNKNSQIALDKQLNHQSETFQTQLKDQAEGFKDQMNHQSELLERQMKHQSDENDKERKQKFKHDQYIKLINGLNEAQRYFSISIIYNFDSNEAINRLAAFKAITNLCNITSSIKISESLDKLYKIYHPYILEFIQEANEILRLQAKLKQSTKILGWIDEGVESVAKKQFENIELDFDLTHLGSERIKLFNQITEENSKIILEQTRLMELFKTQVKEINLNTAVIVRLINIELGYTSLEDFINNGS